MGRTLIDVIARMNQLPPLPRDADAPRISLGENGGGGPNETLSWFFVQLKPGTPGPVENYRREVEDLMRSRVESIPGVGTINVNAGAPDELRIEFDPYRAAELGIPIPSIVGVAGSADDVSGGFAELGRRQYTLRFAGRYRPGRPRRAGARLARRPAGAARGRRDDLGRARRPQLARRAEQQPGDRASRS